MKQILCIILAAFVLFAGCAKQSGEQYNSVNFYYKTDPIDYESDSGIISTETRLVSGAVDNYTELLRQYLNGARKRNCISPFPAGTTLESFSMDDSIATVTLSSHLSLLTDHELMIACICMARTVFDLTDVQAVHIRSLNNYLDGKPYIEISQDSYVLFDYSYKAD